MPIFQVIFIIGFFVATGLIQNDLLDFEYYFFIVMTLGITKAMNYSNYISLEKVGQLFHQVEEKASISDFFDEGVIIFDVTGRILFKNTSFSKFRCAELPEVDTLQKFSAILSEKLKNVIPIDESIEAAKESNFDERRSQIAKSFTSDELQCSILDFANRTNNKKSDVVLKLNGYLNPENRGEKTINLEIKVKRINFLLRECIIFMSS
eukprot:TRINITY_DN10508_c0_g1_i2.p1 TRINITY_DN10508_c0_g1~~TRINITY_DN10508_c0_g1_i2.p1  ORF type:complete len:208 (+),score=34.57 TRINITY_DN10508_c0_g1_i2:382-1005(+)